jgi:KDO2-lipid IV(A) lauroyltransferase
MFRVFWLRELLFLLEYLPLRLLLGLVESLSPQQVCTLVHGISRFAYRFSASQRDWCLRNLHLVFGDHLTAGQRKKFAQQSFEHFWATIAEMLSWTPEWMETHVKMEMAPETQELARRSQEQGTGVILVTAHLGNFELMAAWMHRLFPDWRTAVVYRPLDNWRVEQLIERIRGRYLKANKLTRGFHGTLGLLGSLREGNLVGLLIDQNTTRGGVFVDFLGFQASTAPGAAALAMETGCPVVLAMSVRQPDGTHRIVVHPPFELIRTGDWRRDLAVNTQQYTKALEEYVLAYPEQYFWAHPRWRFRPDRSSWNLTMTYEQMAAERHGPPRRPWTAQPQEANQAAA